MTPQNRAEQSHPGSNAYMNALPKLAPQSAGPVPPKGGGSWRAVFIIAIVILALSLLALGAIGLSYFQGQQKYRGAAEFIDTATEAAAIDPINAEIDWDGLRAINSDIVAWVTVPNTPINYPVVRGKDNDYYLSHDFYKDQGWLANFGAIFMDYRNVPNWSDQLYFLYGHHMNDGSMFAAVAEMADQARFDNERIIYIYSPAGNFKLRSYSLIHCGADEPLVQVMFDTPAEMAAYVQDKIDRSIVNVGEIPAADAITKTFAFSTCDSYSVGRYVLFAYIEQTTVYSLERERKQAPAVGDSESRVSDKPETDESASSGASGSGSSGSSSTSNGADADADRDR